MEEEGNRSLRGLRADLHIHTCLSPCATLDMTPRKIVQRSLERGLHIIGITDHNSAENAGAVMAAARGTRLTVVPGMEITTSEEVHILGLFGSVDAAIAMQEQVYERLQPGKNDEDLFGIQVIANAWDEVEGISERLFIGAVAMGIHEAVEAIHRLRGMAVAAHVDRQAFSILGQLGFIPDDLALDALEISGRIPLRGARTAVAGVQDFPLITASDAHDLTDIGKSPTIFWVAGPDLTELHRALQGVGGRGIGH